MNLKKTNFLFLTLYLLCSILVSCKGTSIKDGGTITVFLDSDPDHLNPITKSNNSASRVSDMIFSSLLALNPSGNFELEPYILKSKPVITDITSGELKGGLKLEFDIKDEATWDNGTPITGYDYLFTLKAILNPKTNCEMLRGSYSWLADVIIDSLNPKKFTVYSNKKHYKIEEYAAGYIMPEYNYDSTKIMRAFSLKDLLDETKNNVLSSNTDIIKFATEFNSEKFSREAKYIVGSGPYKIDHWTTSQEIVLKRKENWWGDKFKQQRVFWAFPTTIKLKIISDKKTALTALKGGEIDALFGIPAKDFKELESNPEFLKKYDIEKIGRFGYNYLSFNLRNPKFQDIKVRQAIAHAIDKEKINKIIYLGEATKTESFIHSNQPFYNKNLKPFDYNIATSNQLLDEAGWKDSDGDGIRDKMFNGKKTSLSITFKYAKDEPTKNTILMIQEALKTIGVAVTLQEKEMTMLTDEIKQHDFEMYLLGSTISATMTDPKLQWHTSSSLVGGSNISGWGSETTDKLIESLISDIDYKSRASKYIELQQKIHDDVPVIFLFNPVNRIATSRKIEVEKILISPGLLYNEFKQR